MKRFLNLPSPALVIASLSLIVSLGGISYAATQLPKNSVGAKQIKKGAVGSSEIKKNAVDTFKIKNGSLKAGDFKAGQIPAGPAGPKGATGAPGVAFGVLSYRQSAEVDNPAGEQTSAQAVCDSGTFAVGGGGYLSSFQAGRQQINSSFSTDGNLSEGTASPGGSTGWLVAADNTSASNYTVTAYVVCAPAAAIAQKTTKKSVKK